MAASADAPAGADAEAPLLARKAMSADQFPEAAQATAARYGLDSLLGVGASGRVYAVVDRDLDREVALKVLVASGDSEAKARFIDEARIAASLTHPNVLPVHDIDVDHRGRPYFTMPRIGGHALASVLQLSTRERREPPLSDLNAVVNMAIGVCQALGYAHHRGIVHQDIKPENIVLGDYGEILLVDWGSAIRLDAAGPQRLYGTPLYMSPEQARRENVDRRSDIYGLGATLFHALFLRPPTWSDDPDEFWNKKRRGDVDAPTLAEDGMSPAPLTAIALKAMAADPGRRYQRADDMLADLRAYQAGQAVSAYRDGVRAAVARWYRRNRRAVWTGAVAVALLAVILGMFAAEKAKDQASWHLIYGPGFPAEVSALAKDWSAQKENWWEPKREAVAFSDAAHIDQDALRDHVLRARGPANGWLDIAYLPSPLGAIKYEWDFASPDLNADFNCFIGGADRMSGYTFHVGSWGNPSYVALTRGKDYEVLDNSYLPEPLAKARTYHFSLEKEGGRLRLIMDGRTVFDYLDPTEIYGDTPNVFGFDCPGPAPRVFSNVSIYHRPLPQRVSPLIVGDKLLQLGDYVQAEAQYIDLERSYPGTAIARAALFRQAVCALRAHTAEDDARGLALLARFEQDNPGHELIPYALYERLQVARRHGEVDEALRLRTALAAYRSHPLLRMVMTQIAQEHMVELEPLPVGAVSDPVFRADTGDRIVTTYAELRAWGERYGVSWWSNIYGSNSWRVLSQFGRFRDLADSYPAESTPANQARLNMGLYDDVLRLTTEPYQRIQAQFQMGLVGDKPEYGWFYWQCRMERGGAAAVADDPACDGTVRCQALLMLGRYEEVMRAAPNDKPLMTEALIGLKRYDELAGLDFPVAVARGLLAQDRIGELIVANPRAYEVLYRAVVRLLELGQRDQAHALLADLDRAQVPCDADELGFAKYVFPALLPIAEENDAAHRDPVVGASTRAAIDTSRLASALASPLERTRWLYGQRIYHLCAFIAGTIDEAGFLAQPCKRALELRLTWARALRADHRGSRADALAAYRAIAADPRLPPTLSAFEQDYLRWRLAELVDGK